MCPTRQPRHGIRFATSFARESIMMSFVHHRRFLRTQDLDSTTDWRAVRIGLSLITAGHYGDMSLANHLGLGNVE